MIDVARATLTAPPGSPLGALTVLASRSGIRGIRFGAPDGAIDEAHGGVLDAAVSQLRAYLAGDLDRFDLPIDLAATPFERRVLDALLAVPYGTLVTYGDLARELGQPGAARAIGRACNHNPIPIVIPCHRVVAADGTLGGYAAGTAAKRWLLELERGAPAVPPGGWEPAGRSVPDAPRLFDPG